jgi:hypothetical protein
LPINFLAASQGELQHGSLLRKFAEGRGTTLTVLDAGRSGYVDSRSICTTRRKVVTMLAPAITLPALYDPFEMVCSSPRIRTSCG